NCHTYYSYKYGTLSIENLLNEASAKKLETIALTDINSTSACLDFIRLCPKQGIKPVVGIDFRKGAKQQFIGIAKNNRGFRELNEYLSYCLHTETPIPTQAPGFENAFIIYPFSKTPYSTLRPNEFVGIRPSDLNRFRFSQWNSTRNRLVILQPVTFRNNRDFNAHRLLRAIDNNMLLSKLPKSEEGSPDEIMHTNAELEEIFKDYPTLIQNTKNILEECSIEFDYKTAKNKKTFTGSPVEDIALMRRECLKGLEYRFGKNPSQAVLDRMKKELSVIFKLNFCSYFLINWDMVRYARHKDYCYVGRGSGANSMVAYLLRITDVDPLELDLYFERFINPYRSSPPDFDIDFPSRDRNDVTKYLFDTHGWDHTALVGTYNTFQYRSMLRELGKVFGLPAREIDKIQSAKSFAGMDDMSRLVVKYSKLINGFPSHLSVHSSGILISDETISTYGATMMPPKGFPTVHFSMIEAEDIGLSKFDVLGQRGLSKIKDSVKLIEDNTGDKVDIYDFKKFKKDRKVKELLREGLAIGCFYVESPAMRMLLKKLQADDYLRLVAASSIIRPGVSKSGMMREYILRYRHPERRAAARQKLPELYDIMAETYGVMVYQEDVIKVAHYFAGLTLAEADILRRGMSWKFKQRNEFDKVRDKFFANCDAKNYPKTVITEVWRQIESFANYAFSKGHSASYAVESYQALYLKAHYPLEYLVATINNGGGFYRSELYVHEARMHGAQIENPCVNISDGKTSINGIVIHLGLGLMRDLNKDSIRSLLIARREEGAFSNLANFINRVSISLEQLKILIRVGAFRFTDKGKKELLWDAHFMMGNTKKTTVPVKTLFNTETKVFKLPPLHYHRLEAAFDEIEILHFPVNTSPFALVENLPDIPFSAREIPFHVDKIVTIVGYLIHVKGTSTSKNDYMSFGVFVDQRGHWIDSVQFPDVARRYPFRGPGCYIIKGKVTNEFGFISIEVSELHRLNTVSMDNPSTRLKSTDNYGAPSFRQAKSTQGPYNMQKPMLRLNQ
ncbi:MAG: DNA polymerase III subunit alpha, partial [Flavobacteriales bacterium]|nr:DNA polymerase III subunit alpha [Flavobacteriales bacterium]